MFYTFLQYQSKQSNTVLTKAKSTHLDSCFSETRLFLDPPPSAQAAAAPAMASPFSFSATHGVNNPPFTSESTPPAAAAAAAPPPKPKGFSFGISLAQEKAEPKPSIFGSSTAAPATATTGFTFGAAQQPTAPAPPAPTTSAFGGGFGAFGGGGFGTFGQPAAAAPQAAAATRPSTFGGDGGCGFGLQDSLPPSPFGSAQPSGFGIPSSFLGPSAFGAPGAFGTTHQEPSPPPPNSTSGGFGFGGGGSCFGTTALQKTEAAPSTTAAAEVAKVLTVKSFGVEVKPSDMGRAHPSTFQVPPTSTSFSTPAQVSAPVAQETKQAPAVKTTTNASDDAVKKTTQEEADTSNKKKKEEKKQKQKKKKAVNALVIDEDEGSVEFPSREDAEFRYRLTLTKSDKIKVWLEGKSSKLQWYVKRLCKGSGVRARLRCTNTLDVQGVEGARTERDRYEGEHDSGDGAEGLLRGALRDRRCV